MAPETPSFAPIPFPHVGTQGRNNLGDHRHLPRVTSLGNPQLPSPQPQFPGGTACWGAAPSGVGVCPANPGRETGRGSPTPPCHQSRHKTASHRPHLSPLCPYETLCQASPVCPMCLSFPLQGRCKPLATTSIPCMSPFVPPPHMVARLGFGGHLAGSLPGRLIPAPHRCRQDGWTRTTRW